MKNEINEIRIKKLIKDREMKLIPISKIKGKATDKKELKKMQIKGITNEISRYGLLTPISVTGPYKDGTYRIVDGKRRYEAINSSVTADIKIPCYVVAKDIKKSQVEELSLIANIGKKVNKNVMLFKYASFLLENKDEDDKRSYYSHTFAAMTGTTVRYANKIMRIVEQATPMMEETILDEKISLATAYNIIKEAENEEEQNEMLEKYLEQGNKIFSQNKPSDYKKDMMNAFVEVMKNSLYIRDEKISSILIDFKNYLPEGLKDEMAEIIKDY